MARAAIYFSTSRAQERAAAITCEASNLNSEALSPCDSISTIPGVRNGKDNFIASQNITSVLGSVKIDTATMITQICRGFVNIDNSAALLMQKGLRKSYESRGED